jgi:hypothetical protein
VRFLFNITTNYGLGLRDYKKDSGDPRQARTGAFGMILLKQDRQGKGGLKFKVLKQF